MLQQKLLLRFLQQKFILEYLAVATSVTNTCLYFLQYILLLVFPQKEFVLELLQQFTEQAGIPYRIRTDEFLWDYSNRSFRDLSRSSICDSSKRNSFLDSFISGIWDSCRNSFCKSLKLLGVRIGSPTPNLKNNKIQLVLVLETPPLVLWSQ